MTLADLIRRRGPSATAISASTTAFVAEIAAKKSDDVPMRADAPCSPRRVATAISATGIEGHRVAGIAASACTSTTNSEPMSAAQELAIRAWLRAVGELDPLVIRSVVQQCHADAEARLYFLTRAKDNSQMEEIASSLDGINAHDQR